MSMVEKVAKAIARAAVEQNHMLQYYDDSGIGYFDDYDNKNYDCIAIARAAIEALMEPNANMTGAVAMNINADQVWRAMIQAALKEGQ